MWPNERSLSTKLAHEDELDLCGKCFRDGADSAPEPWRMLPAFPDSRRFRTMKKTALGVRGHETGRG